MIKIVAKHTEKGIQVKSSNDRVQVVYTDKIFLLACLRNARVTTKQEQGER
ncbi:hypothetical protein WH47_04828 [Habropoda laboriosa]|uniref:Uncharacterized protein n=1 Tax=Habropoda laboriosa TaxID=597456 RepID=A0A0L7QVZ4_9HYME|nr:hypothetical protein WH47_04828 [Habropoda laboriosa]